MRKTLTLLLAAGAIAASTGDAHAGTVKCGAILAAGKTYVLKHDLTCSSGLGWDEDGTLRAALSVIDDATLDLNGHTLTCARRTKDRGVKVQRATIRNGTIRGCYTAAVAYSGVVQGMVFTGNRLGVAAMEFSMIAENIAVKNEEGFFEPEDGDPGRWPPGSDASRVGRSSFVLRVGSGLCYPPARDAPTS